MYVKDMIKRILSVDKLARDTKSSMQKRNVTREEIMKAREKEIREDYLSRAAERVKRNSLLEEENARLIMDKANAETEEKLKKLEELREKNEELWVEKISARVLGPWKEE